MRGVVIFIVVFFFFWGVRVLVGIFEFVHSEGEGCECGGNRWVWEALFDYLKISVLKCLRKHNLELNEQISILIRSLKKGHAHLLDRHDLFRADHLPLGTLNSHFPPVQHLDLKRDPRQRLHEQDLPLQHQIGALPREHLVRLLVHNHDQIPGQHPGVFIPLPVEHDLLAMWGAFRDLDLKQLEVLDGSGSLAGLALVLDEEAGSETGGAFFDGIGEDN